jgi:hypothetical protein
MRKHHRHRHRHTGAAAPLARNGVDTFNSRTVYEVFTDLMVGAKIPAVLINGVFTVSGNEEIFNTHIDAGADAIAANQ